MSDHPAFLGRGWQFPPAFAEGGASVAMVAGVDDIAQSLQILLATRRGERVLREDFGCALDEFQFSEMGPALVGRVRDRVAEAILRDEPRVVLNAVEVAADDAAEGVLRVSVDYTVRATNSRYNLVYPFYLDESVASAGWAGTGAGR